ncbi:unnamed protein product, partial [Tetraodon nigroviridis]
ELVWNHQQQQSDLQPEAEDQDSTERLLVQTHLLNTGKKTGNQSDMLVGFGGRSGHQPETPLTGVYHQSVGPQ